MNNSSKNGSSGGEIELNEKQNRKEDFTYPFILLKYQGNIVGCGKLADLRVLNFVPKERRLFYKI